MAFLPKLPLHINSITFFSLTLLLGLIGGEITRLFRFLPHLSGYMAIGFLMGPTGLDIVTPSMLISGRALVDIALGLILFDIGRTLDFAWLRYDRSLLLMSITESSLTFILTLSTLLLFKFPLLQSMLAAIIATGTSPAIFMMIANNLSSEGPVTRRTMILISLNNLFAIIFFTLLLPITQAKTLVLKILLGQMAYLLFGSIALGIIMFLVAISIASLIGKKNESQFMLFIGIVTLTIGLAFTLHLSSMLTLFTLGVAARNFDYKHKLMEIDFGWLSHIFFILLFVVVGVNLQLTGIWNVIGVVLTFIFVRFFAKTSGIWLLSKMSRITKKQTFALCLTLSPMSGVAIGMSNQLVDFDPDFSRQLMTVMIIIITLLNIITPILTQFSLINVGEALSEKKQARNNK